MDSGLGKSERHFWLDCNKWSITFLVIEGLNGNEILFEIRYSSIKEFTIDDIAENTWILNIILDKCFFKLVLSAEHRLIRMLRKRLSRFTQKSFKESITNSPIIVKPKEAKSKRRTVGVFRCIQNLLISEFKAKWSRIKGFRSLLILRVKQVRAQCNQRIDSSE